MFNTQIFQWKSFLILFFSILFLLFNFRRIFPQKLFRESRSDVKYIRSPFDRTLAFIRWNSAHIQRIPLIEKYRPFFNELHYSIPSFTNQVNLTADGLIKYDFPYKMVSETMEIILNGTYSSIQGILFFHFDAWINPFKFVGMNFENIWFLDSTVPPFICMKSEKEIFWWSDINGLQRISQKARKLLEEKHPKKYFIKDENEFCVGWSDIYYIPRRFFRDFILLSNIYHSAGTFHEIAIPTIVKIIDFTYRLSNSHSIITKISDCWGNCCSSGAKSIDLQMRRCGHRMDLNNEIIQKTFLQSLQSQLSLINKTFS
ncbi:unnamed protein product [Adineta ricciae]|uniref:Uncharacterized protein n=1 Tax=Adineta ricciae TaxID=249248 RepID=A0A814JY71_ADIRI|nr:unnamed protein product [Adineta ricciae]